jgi:hypothetical protein
MATRDIVILMEETGDLFMTAAAIDCTDISMQHKGWGISGGIVTTLYLDDRE